MKPLLAALLCLLTLPTHAQTWPRNPKTGKVEFTGVLPWPTMAKTDVQRRALVRKWYLAKLTTRPATQVVQDADGAVSPALLTYAKLPNDVLLRYGSGDNAILLVYQITLLPTPRGLSYTFFNFDWATEKDAVATGDPLEQILTDQTQQAALAQLRKRLASAVAGW